MSGGYGSHRPYPGSYTSVPTMDLYIESLTGITFEMTVSPFETILSIKAKIQRVEGIPVSQQHIVYNSQELEDNACLLDYSIPDGATLKLVLSMRGGPISTRRVPPMGEELAWREIKDYVESNRSELWDKSPAGSKVTVLVFREGNEVNFFKVVENNDGTYSPLSESWSGSSIRNLFAEGDEEEVNKRVTENANTMTKMQDLRNRMEKMNIQKKTKKSPRVLSGKRSVHQRRCPSRTKIRSPHNHLHLPVIDQSSSSGSIINNSRPKTPSSWYSHRALHSPKGTSDLPKKESLPQRPASRRSFPTQSRISADISTLPDISERHYSAYRRSLLKLNSDSTALLKSVEDSSSSLLHQNSSESTIQTRRSRDSENCGHDIAELYSGKRETIKDKSLPPKSSHTLNRLLLDDSGDCKGVQQGLSKSLNSGLKERRQSFSLQRVHEFDDLRPKTSPDKFHSLMKDLYRDGVVSPAGDMRAQEICEILNNSRRRNYSQDDLFDSNVAKLSNRHSDHGFSGNDNTIWPARTPRYGRRSLNQPLERVSRPKIQHDKIQSEPVVAELKLERRLQRRLSASRQGRLNANLKISLNSDINGSVPKKVPRHRCGTCNKKLTITNIYSCRCGKLFCSGHRYAETHGCTFDYKTEGRKLIEQANPLVTASKLPKI